MTNEDLQLLRELITTVGASGNYLIAQYTKLVIVNGITGITAGLLLITASAWCFVSLDKYLNEDYDKPLLKTLLGVAFLLGIASVLMYIPNIVTPEAAAIKSLLNKQC